MRLKFFLFFGLILNFSFLVYGGTISVTPLNSDYSVYMCDNSGIIMNNCNFESNKFLGEVYTKSVSSSKIFFFVPNNDDYGIARVNLILGGNINLGTNNFNSYNFFNWDLGLGPVKENVCRVQHINSISGGFEITSNLVLRDNIGNFLNMVDEDLNIMVGNYMKSLVLIEVYDSEGNLVRYIVPDSVDGYYVYNSNSYNQVSGERTSSQLQNHGLNQNLLNEIRVDGRYPYVLMKPNAVPVSFENGIKEFEAGINPRDTYTYQLVAVPIDGKCDFNSDGLLQNTEALSSTESAGGVVGFNYLPNSIQRGAELLSNANIGIQFQAGANKGVFLNDYRHLKHFATLRNQNELKILSDSEMLMLERAYLHDVNFFGIWGLIFPYSMNDYSTELIRRGSEPIFRSEQGPRGGGYMELRANSNILLPGYNRAILDDFTFSFFANGGNSGEILFDSRNQNEIRVLRTGSGLEINVGGVSRNINLNGWTHVLVTREGSGVRIYRNGELAHTFTHSGALRFPISIGSAYSSNSFSGGISEVSFWTRSFTGIEAIALYDVRNLGANSLSRQLYKPEIGSGTYQGCEIDIFGLNCLDLRSFTFRGGLPENVEVSPLLPIRIGEGDLPNRCEFGDVSVPVRNVIREDGVYKFIDRDCNLIELELEEEEIYTIRIINREIGLDGESVLVSEREEPIKMEDIAVVSALIRNQRDENSLLDFARKSYEVMTKLDITREAEYDPERDRTVVTLRINNVPSSERINLTMYEVLPKSIARDFSDIVFLGESSGKNFVLDKDPVIGWYFGETGENEEVSYEIPGESEGGSIVITQEPILFNLGDLIVNYREDGCVAGEAALFEFDELDDSKIYELGSGRLYTLCVAHKYEILSGGDVLGLSYDILGYNESEIGFGSRVFYGEEFLDMSFRSISVENSTPIYWHMAVGPSSPSYSDYSCLGSISGFENASFGDCGFSSNRIWLYLGPDLIPPRTSVRIPFLSHIIEVELVAEDFKSGFDRTYYCVGSSCDNFEQYSGPFNLRCPNADTGCTRDISFYSVDMAGNFEEVQTRTLRILERGSTCRADCTATPTPNRFLKECSGLNYCEFRNEVVAQRCDFLSVGSYVDLNSTHEIMCPNGPVREKRITQNLFDIRSYVCENIITIPFRVIVDNEEVIMRVISCMD